MGLILLSGLGFPVWWEVMERVQELVKENRPVKILCEDSRFIRNWFLTTTMILVFGGALLILALDWNHAPSLWQPETGAEGHGGFFQSVTTRTAGF